MELKKLEEDLELIKLEIEFDSIILEDYKKAWKEFKYSSVIFARMINDHGGVETVKRLIVKTLKPPAGFLFFYEKGRLDYTLEGFIFNNQKFKKLFTHKENQRICDILENYHYIKKKEKSVLNRESPYENYQKIKCLISTGGGK